MSQVLSCLHRSPHNSPPRTTKIKLDLAMCQSITFPCGAIADRHSAVAQGLEAGTHIMWYVKVDVTGLFAHPYFMAGPKGPRDFSTRKSPIV